MGLRLLQTGATLSQIIENPELATYVGLTCCVLGIGLLAGIAVHQLTESHRLLRGSLMVVCTTVFGGLVLSTSPSIVFIGGLFAAAVAIVLPILVILSIVNQLMQVPIGEQ